MTDVHAPNVGPIPPLTNYDVRPAGVMAQAAVYNKPFDSYTKRPRRGELAWSSVPKSK